MGKKQKAVQSLAEVADKYHLYQLAVQSTEPEHEFIDSTFKAVRGRRARSMREDFSGTALSSVEWVKRSAKNTAVAVDLDPEVLAWGQANNVSDLSKSQQKRIQLCHDDVLKVKTAPVDVVQALNFSYWLFQERATMLKYFRKVRKALVDDGLFFLDAFGGYDAHRNQEEPRDCEAFTYIWEQAEHNPVTGSMQCYIHFELPDGSRIDRAFSYPWRIWGAKEIREVLADAGFSRSTLYLQAFDEETDEPIDEYVATNEAEDWACWIGYIVAER